MQGIRESGVRSLLGANEELRSLNFGAKRCRNGTSIMVVIMKVKNA